jgi:hypothetical protein
MLLQSTPTEIFNTLFNWSQFWGLVGIVLSSVGIGYTIIQVRRIASETETIQKTYNKAFNELKANELISNLSVGLEKVRIIRQGFALGSLEKCGDDIPALSRSLTLINNAFPNNEAALNSYITFSSKLYIDFATGKKVVGVEETSSYIQTILEIEMYLSRIEGEIKFKNK